MFDLSAATPTIIKKNMKINLIKNFEKHEKKITDVVVSSIEEYNKSKCFKVLTKRMKKLDDSIDMEFSNGRGNKTNGQFYSNFVIPLTREAFNSSRAIISSVFTNPDLVTFFPDGHTPAENAANMDDLMKTIMKNTMFVEDVLNGQNGIIYNVSRYGAAVVCSYWDSREKTVKKTAPMRMGEAVIGYQREQKKQTKKGVYCHSLNIKNYFQQPDQPDPYKARYMGYHERIAFHKIVNEYQSTEADYKDSWIVKNLKDLETQIKKGCIEDKNYDNRGETTGALFTNVDRSHWYGKLDFEGNRSDDTDYYVQVSNGKIIRFEENPYDENLVPINIYCTDPRPEYWWGNSEPENVIPMESYLRMTLSLSATSAMQELQRYIFYDANSGIDPVRIHEAAKSGGFIPFMGKTNQRIQDVFYQVQFPSIATNNLQYMSNEAKEAASRARTKPDFSRQENEGGLRNKTAAAANIMASEGNVQEQYYLTQFSYCLQRHINTMAILVKQYIGETFILNKPNQGKIELLKSQILGDFTPVVKTALTYSQSMRAQNLLNFITAIVNFKKSGLAEFNIPQLIPALKEWTKVVIDNLDSEAIFPSDLMNQQAMLLQNQQMQQMQQMLGLPQPAPQGAIPMIPQQQGVQ